MKEKIEKIATWIDEKVVEAGCKGVVFGLSGGIDSAVVAALCQMKKSKNMVVGLIMPCESQKQDELDAQLVAEHLKLTTVTIPLDNAFNNINTVCPCSKKLAKSNLKARLRMSSLYCFANEYSYLVVGTGNKTEIMVGYCTKYGDGGVDIQPIGDFYKTEVFELAKELGIPEKIINKAPSAGLWVGQTDEEEMGITYKELDRILMAWEYRWTYAYTPPQKFCEEENVKMDDFIKVVEMVSKSKHKRNMPPICQVTHGGFCRSFPNGTW